MLRDVSLKRSMAANRVIYFPHCGHWVRSSPLIYVVQAVMIAFHADAPVIAVSNQVQQIMAATNASPKVAANQDAITHLLAFAAMYCFVCSLRLFVYADQLNALLEELESGGVAHHLATFPFSILRSSVVPYWSALGVIIVTAVSANNNILDEVRLMHSCSIMFAVVHVKIIANRSRKYPFFLMC